MCLRKSAQMIFFSSDLYHSDCTKNPGGGRVPSCQKGGGENYEPNICIVGVLHICLLIIFHVLPLCIRHYTHTNDFAMLFKVETKSNDITTAKKMHRGSTYTISCVQVVRKSFRLILLFA